MGTKPKALLPVSLSAEKKMKMWLGVQQSRVAVAVGGMLPWALLVVVQAAGWGTCQDTHACLGCCRARPVCPRTGVTCCRGQQGHQLQEGGGTTPAAPRTADGSCTPLPGHPGPP